MPTPSDQDDPEERRAAIAAIGHDLPPWHAWEGVIAGLLYARRPDSSPPIVVRSTTPTGLRQEIERAEKERGLREMTDEAISSDLADLRKEFEGSGFTFGSVWASAGSGPDARRLFASHGTLLITSWSAVELRVRIREEMRRGQ